MKNTKKFVTIAMLGALATVLMTLKFPLFVPFYKLDASEAVVLIGSYLLGPIAGVAIEAIKVLLNLLIDGTVTAGVGEAANFIMGCSLVVPAGLIFKKNPTLKGAIIGGAVGIVCLSLTASLLNLYVLLPAYAAAFGMELKAIVAFGTKVNANADTLTSFIVYITLPFNLIKGAASVFLASLLYSKTGELLKKLFKSEI
ncbi:MAG: ECF transporter S component [Eubacteriaceae bacterium]|nr:ECF transporter S component [Eubacteriaceae bacterium]